MVRKILKYVVILLILAVLGTNYVIKSLQHVPYGIAVEADNHRTVTVNDELNTCDMIFAEQTIPPHFKKIAENEQLALYLEEEAVAIAVTDRCNGYTWFSYDVERDMEADAYSIEMINYIKSGVSLVTYDKFTPGRRTVLDANVHKTYTMRDDGFIVTIDFKNAKIKFDLVVTLQGGDLLVHVPQHTVHEYDAKLWQPGNNDISMNEMIVYPFLGSVSHKEDGYIVIPDGSGAIVKLDETPTHATGYTASVYGKDLGYENTIHFIRRGLSVKPLEKISLPLYGIIHDVNKVGMLVVSESGASYATYNYVSRDLTTHYYQSYFTYNYRTTYSQFQSRVNEDQHVLGFQEKPNQFDLVQRYVFLNDDQANYVGVAKKYRALLEKKEGLSKRLEQAFDKTPLKVDFVNNEVVFGTLGVENVAATSYTQAKELIKKFKQRGYEHLNVTFKTFVLNELSYRFDVMKQLGGRKDLRDAIQYFADNTIKFNYYVDYARSYFDKTKYTASKMNRQDFSVLDPNKNQHNYLNNPKYYKTLAEKEVPDFKKYSIDRLALDGFSGSLFSHYDKGTIGSSTEGMAYVEDLFQYLHEQGLKTSAYHPDAYLFTYLDDYFDAPIASSELLFIDATIPLVSLVLTGYTDLYSPYMNFSSNDTDVMLRLIEFGIYPSFILTGESTYDLKWTASNDVYVSELSNLEDRIQSYYTTVSEALDEMIGYDMINHTIVSSGVILVQYSNGKDIVINYNDVDVSYGDVQIKSKGFVIL